MLYTTVRLANSLKDALDNGPFAKYDLKIGTSERGTVNVESPNFLQQIKQAIMSTQNNMTNNTTPSSKKKDKNKKKCYFRHALIVFGGVSGIEECVDADETLKTPGSESRKLFDLWVNVCPFQASKTIRTEEAVFIALATMNSHLATLTADTDEDEENENEHNNKVDDDNTMDDRINEVDSDDEEQEKDIAKEEAFTTIDNLQKSKLNINNQNNKPPPAINFSDEDLSDESSGDDDD